MFDVYVQNDDQERGLSVQESFSLDSWSDVKDSILWWKHFFGNDHVAMFSVSVHNTETGNWLTSCFTRSSYSGHYFAESELVTSMVDADTTTVRK